MRHVVCFSGGHSSGLVAHAVVARYGAKNVVLLNHDMSHEVEHPDIKRFKLEVSAVLGVPVTYANYPGCNEGGPVPNQFDVCETLGIFKQPSTNNAMCTHVLKTLPFEQWLADNCQPEATTIYYGFDQDEAARINRRNKELNPRGFRTCYPMAEWGEVLENIEVLGVARPVTYEIFQHGNCVGCLKGGLKHWYVVYCTRPDIYQRAIVSEERLGYSINTDQRTSPRRPLYLTELAPIFALMRDGGVPVTEHMADMKFNHYLRRFRLEGADAGGCRRCLW